MRIRIYKGPKGSRTIIVKRTRALEKPTRFKSNVEAANVAATLESLVSQVAGDAGQPPLP